MEAHSVALLTVWLEFLGVFVILSTVIDLLAGLVISTISLAKRRTEG
jgi:hypothetical protein